MRKRGSVIESKVGAERRLDAPPPGPIVKREYIDPLGIDVRSLAAHVGLDAVRLAGILAGAVSLDVDASIRLARALGLPAERLMQMQVRYDFSAARTVVSLNDIEVIGPTLTPAFPAVDFFSGRLGRASDPFGDGSLYFQDDAARKTASDTYSG
ncbi:MAG: HigA family addiction module antidote protein, partial [Candidatus Eremiobacteraeota bacterium]|nr:HigA family addiction module antidote protein [Candidatus Eremiobacteraeota bacterium]